MKPAGRGFCCRCHGLNKRTGCAPTDKVDLRYVLAIDACAILTPCRRGRRGRLWPRWGTIRCAEWADTDQLVCKCFTKPYLENGIKYGGVGKEGRKSAVEDHHA